MALCVRRRIMYHYGGSTGPGPAARVRSVDGEVCRRERVDLIRRILMKQQNPIENQCVGASVIDLFTSAIFNE